MMTTCADRTSLSSTCWRWFAASALVLSCSVTALAAPTAADDATATSLYKQGVAKREAGHTKEAIELFRKSHALQTSPRPGIEAGKLLMAAGLLIEAQEVFKEVVRLPPYKETDKTKAMRAEAAKLAGDLEGRIGTLIIRLKGDLAGRTVWLDDQEYRPEMLGVTWRVNPTTHTVELRQDGRVLESRKVSVAEGSTAEVELTSPTSTAADAKRADEPTRASREPDTVRPPPAEAPRSGGRTLRTVGWIGVGVGAASLGAGLVFGAMAASKANEADPWCQSSTECHDPRGLSLRDEGLSFASASTALVIAGSVLAVGGLVLVWTAPRSAPRETSLQIGPTGLILAGKF